MKRIEKIEVKPKPYIKEIAIYICDLCGKEGKDESMFRTCCLCKRLVHRDWSHPKEDCVESYDDGSDYPDWYCKICYKLKFVDYKIELEIIEEEQYQKEEALEQKIIKESLDAIV